MINNNLLILGVLKDFIAGIKSVSVALNHHRNAETLTKDIVIFASHSIRYKIEQFNNYYFMLEYPDPTTKAALTHAFLDPRLQQHRDTVIKYVSQMEDLATDTEPFSRAINRIFGRLTFVESSTQQLEYLITTLQTIEQ